MPLKPAVFYGRDALDGAQKQVEDNLRHGSRRTSSLLTKQPILFAVAFIQIQKTILIIRISSLPTSGRGPDVGRSLCILGYNLFAVTLMARLAKERLSTAKELISVWSENGPDFLPDRHEQNMNRSISLSVDSNLMPASSIFSPAYQQEHRRQLFAGGHCHSTHQWFHPPLLLYPRQAYWSRIDGKIPTLWSSLCSLLSSRLCNSMAG